MFEQLYRARVASSCRRGGLELAYVRVEQTRAQATETISATAGDESPQLRHNAPTPRGSGASSWERDWGCRLRRVLRGFLVAGLALAAVSCSDASKPAASKASSTSVASPTSPSSSAVDPRADAQAALDAYWLMIKRLYMAPDPQDPEIAQRAVDPSAAAIRDLLTTRRAQDQVAQYDGVPYSVSTTVTSASGTEASFSGCIVDGGRLVVATSGEVVDDKVTTSRVSGSMVLDAGIWKVQRFDVLKKVSGEVSCADLS
jgi:hypothetical protein